MKKLLLHACCAPCSTHVIEKLKEECKLALFFYNPNIEPIDEYGARLKDIEFLAKKLNIELIAWDYDNIEWHNAVKGHEKDKEGAERCNICFRFRLEKTAQYAKEMGFDIFTTTLTVSPYKNADSMNKIGKEIAEKYGIEFLESDFKKENGYFRSIELSKQFKLYRQPYCGCLFSRM